MTRRTSHLAVSALLTAALLSGCGDSGSSSDSSGEASAEPKATFPVSVEHALGTTEVDSAPARVVALSSTDADDALALGVAPVGAARVAEGGTQAGSTSWFDARVKKDGAQAPERLQGGEALVDQVRSLQPDLVLASGAGLTKTQYDALTAVAPVVGAPKGGASWRDSLELAGEALGKSAEADKVTKETQDAIDQAVSDNPSLKGATAIFGRLSSTELETIGVYGPADPKVALLHDFGLVDAPVLKDLVPSGAAMGEVPATKAATLTSDVFVTFARNEDDLVAIESNYRLSRIPAFNAGGGVAELNPTRQLAISQPSPLSIPTVIKEFVPSLAGAVESAE